MVFYFFPIECYINTTKESLDLTIYHHLSLENCSHPFLTLVDFISFCSSIIENTTILSENIITLKLINLCIYINIKSIEKFKSIRRLIFENCTIYFLASQQREDYDFYPKNLSQWSFKQGRTDTFNQFITMINHLGKYFKLIQLNIFFSFKGSLKFDLQLSDCFQPILSFNHFIPLDTQLIFLNITCQDFQIDEPLNIKTRTAIFLTPTLIINTQSNLCPSINKYRWLSLKRSQRKSFSLRIFICENHLIQLNFDINQTIITNRKIDITSQISFIQSTSSNKWTIPIILNFSVILVSILILFVALVAFLIRFC